MNLIVACRFDMAFDRPASATDLGLLIVDVLSVSWETRELARKARRTAIKRNDVEKLARLKWVGVTAWSFKAVNLHIAVKRLAITGGRITGTNGKADTFA